MKFVFLAPRYHTNLHFQIKTLCDRGHRVYFLSLYQGGSEYHGALEPELLGYSPVFLWLNGWLDSSGGNLTKNNFELKYGFPPLSRLLRRLWQIKPDVVVIKNIESAYSLVSAVIARSLGSRIVFLIQIPKYREKHKSWSVALVGWLFGALALTPILGDERWSNANPNLRYLPFSYPAVEIADKAVAPGGVRRLLCVGKFQERKGQLLLLRAITALRSNYKLALTLVGQTDEDAYYSQLRDYVCSQSLEDIVTLKSDLLWEEVQQEYKKHDVFILPSWAESAAYSPLEAMAHGLPVLTSDDNGTKDYIINGENGYHFRAKDVQDLAHKLELIIKDEETIRCMGARGLEEAKTKYNPELFYQNFLEMLG